MGHTVKDTAKNVSQHIVFKKDFPISCPGPKTLLWDQHPRVYLPIEETGEATCPYCGAHYILDREAS